jgi:hypothetical protein
MRSLPALLSVLIIASSTFARPIADWPYEKLFKEADVVLIATAKEVKPSEDKLEGPYKEHLGGRVATLTVRAVLKGEVKGEAVEVVHFAEKGEMRLPNGPMLVVFRTTPAHVEARTYQTHVGTPDYLVFLKAEKDGRYSPVAGQVDSELSVKEIYRPLPDVFFRKQ